MSATGTMKISIGGDHDDRPIVLINFLPQFNFLRFRDRLAASFRLVDHPFPPPSDLPHDILKVRAMVTFGPSPVTADLIRQLPALELVVCTSAGVDKIDMVECRQRGVRVTNASAAFKEDVAEYAVGLLIGVLRRVSAGDRYVRGGSWPAEREYPLGFKLSGKRIGIVGLGQIGSEVAKRLAAFNCIVSYHSRAQKPCAPYTYYGNIRELASVNDAFVLCCALTDQTRHIVDGEVMSALGKDGVIVNVGRGALVDERELVEFLVRGELGGAGLDVFEDEPNLPKEMLELDNVLLSPHTAVTTLEGFAAVEDLAVDNLTAFFQQRPLMSLVQD